MTTDEFRRQLCTLYMQALENVPNAATPADSKVWFDVYVAVRDVGRLLDDLIEE